jgi:hypothetical protein
MKVMVAKNEDFLKTDPQSSEYSEVQYILCDPSCSGSGIVSRMDDLIKYALESEAGQTGKNNPEGAPKKGGKGRNGPRGVGGKPRKPGKPGKQEPQGKKKGETNSDAGEDTDEQDKVSFAHESEVSFFSEKNS